VRALFKTIFGTLWCEERGVTAVVTAFALLALMGFAGLAVDVILWELDGRKIQSAADEAALAGAIASSAADNVTTAVDTVAASYGFVNGKNGTTVVINQNYHNLKQIEVTISQLQPQYFSRIFLPAPTVSKFAVAQPPGAPSNGSTCVLSLAQTGKASIQAVNLNGSDTVTLGNCDLYNDSEDSDSTDLSGGAVLSAKHIILSGGYTISNNASMTPNPPTATYVQPSPDPYAGMAMPTYSGCNQTNYNVNSGQTLTASPGVYCGGITVNGGGTLNLNPGTYILDGGNFDVEGNGTVNGTGVTIVLTSSTGKNYGIIKLAGGSIVSITAPTAGAALGFPGVAIWVDKNAPTATDTFNGGTTENINGAIYLPSQEINYAGGSATSIDGAVTKCTQLVGFTINFTSNSYLTHAYCSAMNLPVRDPVAPPKLAL
jgi:Putative Flp pilus-assembly TadE/G-like